MKAYLFYSSGNHDQEQSTSALVEQLDLLKVETLNLDADSLEGSRLAELYDITQRPSAVIARDDGAMVHRWLGTLPSASDLSYYAHS